MIIATKLPGKEMEFQTVAVKSPLIAAKTIAVNPPNSGSKVPINRGKMTYCSKVSTQRERIVVVISPLIAAKSQLGRQNPNKGGKIMADCDEVP